jgi:hypothetical protein
MINLFRNNEDGSNEDGSDKHDMIPSSSFPELMGKSEEDRRNYLKSASKFAELRTQEAIEWYIRKKRPMRKKARILRFSAITFGAFGVLIPFISISKIIPDTINFNWIEIGYISLGIAVSCISLDKYFGYSSSWIRFIMVSLTLQKLLAKFQYDWAILNSDAIDHPCDANTCKNMLSTIQAFMLEVLSELEKEATEWANEYRNSLAEMEKSTREQSDKKPL